MRILILLLIVFGISNASAELSFNDDLFFSGSNHIDFPGITIDQAVDVRLDNRFITSYKNDFFKAEFHWLFNVQNYKNPDYQIPVMLVVEDDKYSLFNFTNVHSTQNYTMINKIDRLNFTFYNDYYELTVGRTALTWSRGRIFHVTDFFNPQNPGFYDGDYKIGTDLVYLNTSFGNYGSLSLVANPKRNHQTLDVTLEDSTLGVRYLYNNDSIDTSLMVAQYLNDYVLATGLSTDFIYGSVLRGDISFWWPEFDRDNMYLEYVISLERSFDIFTKTSSLYVEYFHNDFGYKGKSDQYIFHTNLTMIKRFQEQDTYLYGKDYMAFGFNMEINQYINFNYSNTINLYDYSNFNSFAISYSASDDLSLSVSAAIPYGKKGDEFGKICGLNGNPNECFKLKPMFLVSVAYSF